MYVSKDSLKEVVANAWDKALEIVDSSEEKDKSAGRIHRRRSERWVHCLAKEFQSNYQDGGECQVFWKCNKSNRDTFFRNEFLFDVLVGRIGTTNSLQKKPKGLQFIEKCEWAIESELDNKNNRQVVVDMSKLVVAAADNKLFVASRHDNEEEFLCLCKDIACMSSGNFYLCLISHPMDWKCPESPLLFELQKSSVWTEFSST